MIKLYGALARKIKEKYPGVDPKAIPCKVKSAEEAIRALESQFKGFKSFIRRKGYYKIIRGDDVMDDSKSLNEKELQMNFSETTWHICPVAAGAGGGGMLQTFLGAAILAIGIVTFYVYPGNPFSVNLMIMGGAMMLGGIVAMLTPVPEIPKNDGNEDTPSYLFNGALNVNTPGVTIPVAYGETFIGSVVASFGIKVEAYS